MVEIDAQINSNHFSSIFNVEEQLSSEEIEAGLHFFWNEYMLGIYNPVWHPLIEEHDQLWNDIFHRRGTWEQHNRLVLVREELGRLGSEPLEYILNPYEIQDRQEHRRLVFIPDTSLPQAA